MILNRICRIDENQTPLDMTDLPEPTPADDEILVKVSTCGVCHTELDEIEGRTPPPRFPVVPGHEVVGRVVEVGETASRFNVGERVGIGWLHSACGNCRFCLSGNENLCRAFKATGRDRNGGYAEYVTVPETSAFPIPHGFSDAEAAPLLCAGAVGYRSLRLTGLENGRNLGLTGFGASGHLVLKMVKHRYPDSNIFVFARNKDQQVFARKLGAAWAGDTRDASPEKLACIIDTTPAWEPVLAALENLAPGGRLVINAIRKEERDKTALLQLDYPMHLWMEKEIKSVANVSRRDLKEFLLLAGEMRIKPDIQEFPLEAANRALVELKTRKVLGAKVLRVG